MKLLIIRHAIAEDKEEWAKSGNGDDLRPLTSKGEKKMAGVARGLRSVVGSIDILAPSPLVRAQQTAAIVAAEFGDLPLETTPVLAPDAPLADVVGWATERAEHALVAIVGHEPHLGVLTTWLLTGVEQPRIELKKGAACLIEFDAAPKAGEGRLLWSLTPAHLRKLGRA